MNDYLILGGFLIVDSEHIHKDWGLTIKDGIIQTIGPNNELRKNVSATRLIDATDKIISPGFINGHNHGYGILSHGIPIKNVPSGFKTFLEEFWWPKVEDCLTTALIVPALSACCYEMINSGITSFCDILEAPNAEPDVLFAEADIVKKSELRGILSIESSERISQENGIKCLQMNADFIQSEICRSNQLIDGMMCTHTSFTCSESFLRQALEVSNSLECDLQLHLSESPYEPEYCFKKYSKRPVEWYDSFNLWGDHILASQLVSMEPQEIEILAKYNVRGVHMPLSNCEVGGGIAPVPELMGKGVKLGLGTDGYINNYFEVMRGAFLIHKANQKNTNVMPAKTVFDMATITGAQVLGLKNVGRLESGYSADLIFINNDFPTPLNEENLLDQLILYRNPDDVELVMTAGKIIKENYLVTTFNRKQVFSDARRAAQQLWSMD